jgi:hypothetical protein
LTQYTIGGNRQQITRDYRELREETTGSILSLLNRGIQTRIRYGAGSNSAKYLSSPDKSLHKRKKYQCKYAGDRVHAKVVIW